MLNLYLLMEEKVLAMSQNNVAQILFPHATPHKSFALQKHGNAAGVFNNFVAETNFAVRQVSRLHQATTCAKTKQ